MPSFPTAKEPGLSGSQTLSSGKTLDAAIEKLPLGLARNVLTFGAPRRALYLCAE